MAAAKTPSCMKGSTVAENVFKISARVWRMAPNAMCGGDRSAELDGMSKIQEARRDHSSCVHQLSDTTNACSAPRVLGGREREALVLKCNRAEQCRPLHRALESTSHGAREGDAT